MCTAAAWKANHFYFGRTLDHTCAYGESITVTPRNFPLTFRHIPQLSSHFAIIGMAHVAGGYPLYYDGVNEKGLAMAGLNFPHSAHYEKPRPGAQNVAQFEFLPYILGTCENLEQAQKALKSIRLVDTPFSEALPTATLHWIIASREGAVVVEATRDGLCVYENPVGVMTNEPPFPEHLFRLRDYMQLSPRQPENRFAPDLPLSHYCAGMGTIGLPGDYSSVSRFVRASYVKENAPAGESADADVSQFFHILGSVEQQRGCSQSSSGECEVTVYTSCCDGDTGVYYYTTYENRQITGVDMHREDLEGSTLSSYPMLRREEIRWQN